MAEQMELGLVPVEPGRGLAIGDRVLVPEALDGGRLASWDDAPLGTVLETRGKDGLRSCLVAVDGRPLAWSWPESYLRRAGGRAAPVVLEQHLAELAARRAARAARPIVWHSGPYDVPGAPSGEAVRHGFTHMIRAETDPERQTREQRHARLGGVVAAAGEVMASRKTRTPESALAEVKALLADGQPRTLNAIGVELWDQTADMVDDKIWWAIVDAVAAGEMEHSMVAPILIRLREKTG